MSCIFSNVSGHSVKSVSTAEEQVLPCSNSVGEEQGGPVATPQESMHRGATIPITEAPIDEVLSVPESQSDRLSFPNVQGTAEKEEEEEEEEEYEEDNEEDGNGKEGNQDKGEEREDKKEDDTQVDVEEEAEDDPAQEECASADEVGSIFPLLLPCTIFYY